jgi:cell division protein FtsB
LVCIVLAVLIKATWSIHQKVVISDTKLAQARAELSKLQARQENLTAQVGYLSTDQGIEAELRTKYRAVKDGESVAVILGDDRTATVTDAVSPKPSGWWQGLLRWLDL